jgi:small acid-soluble spore protein, H-type
MDLKRARQIINSEETIEVLHNGTPVWIESLNPENFTATVKPLNDRGSSRQVPLGELEENSAAG